MGSNPTRRTMTRRPDPPAPTSRPRTMLPFLLLTAAAGVAVLRRLAIERNAREFYRRYGRT